jgi:hypothetical protein
VDRAAGGGARRARAGDRAPAQGVAPVAVRRARRAGVRAGAPRSVGSAGDRRARAHAPREGALRPDPGIFAGGI